MLSGNGRHRRPRQAPALLVAAGVTGSAIAIPLLGASGANAADGTTWDRVAECETGGAWSANHGYGEYGGLRLSQTDWETYGGLDYAPSPDQASRQQQIAVAERILADQGVSVWPTCGTLAGLGRDSAPADVDTGVPSEPPLLPGLTGSSPSPDSSDSSDPSPSPSATSDTPSAETDKSADTPKADTSPDSTPSLTADTGDDSSPSASQEPDGSPAGAPREHQQDDTDKSGSNPTSSDGSAETGTGRHRGDSAAEGAVEGAADGRTADSTGRHASRGGADVRDAADGSYTVRPGDSLWGIADSLELQGGWSALYAENRETVGADPDLILPGQTLALRGETGENQR
jgi:nucleoid-associated protein YgaU